MTLFAIWALLFLPSLLALVIPAIQSGKLLSAIVLWAGVALVPVSAIGLWHFRRWGFICLVVGFIFVIATEPQSIFLHAACILATLVRYYSQEHGKSHLQKTLSISSDF